MVLFTSTSEVALYLTEISKCHASAVIQPSEVKNGQDLKIGHLMDDLCMMLATKYNAGCLVPPLWLKDQYLHIAYYAMLILGDRFRPEQFSIMLLEKHNRYGDKGLVKWGHAGMAMRIGSKVDRFINLTEHPELDTALDETRYDTLADIIGYCVLGLMILRLGR